MGQERSFIHLLVQNLKEHSNLTINTEINKIVTAVQVLCMENIWIDTEIFAV
jgi:hypothetical protein